MSKSILSCWVAYDRIRMATLPGAGVPGGADMKRILVLLCVPVLLVCGCRPAPMDGVELSWAVNETPARRDAVAWFEKENPGIRVRIRPIGEPRQFFLQCLYGDAPDVITFFSADSFQAFARNGALFPLDPGEIAPWPYYDGLVTYCFDRKSGALMALPQVAYPYVLYYNSSLVPHERAMAAETWDDLLALAGELRPRRKKGERQVFGLDIQSPSVWFKTWYRQRGGRFFTGEGAPALDPAKVAETLDAMAAWRGEKGMIPSPSDRLNLPSSGASQGVLGSLFLQGRALFYWSGTWKIRDFKEQRMKWGVRPIPRGPVNGLTLMGGNSFGVSSRAKHPAAAEKFVRYLAGRKGQARHTAHGVYLPALRGCDLPERYRPLVRQAKAARCPEYSPGINEALLKDIFGQTLEAHRLGVWDSRKAAKVLGEALSSGSVQVARD